MMGSGARGENGLVAMLVVGLSPPRPGLDAGSARVPRAIPR